MPIEKLSDSLRPVTALRAGDRVRNVGWGIWGVPEGMEGTVTTGKGFDGSIYTDPAHRLVAVEWDDGRMIGLDKKELQKIGGKTADLDWDSIPSAVVTHQISDAFDDPKNWVGEVSSPITTVVTLVPIDDVLAQLGMIKGQEMSTRDINDIKDELTARGIEFKQMFNW